MSLKINELCVNCDVCEPACPNQAISQGETIYVIDPARCTECVGHFDEPQCVVVCPVECIDPDPDHPESQEQLLAKLKAEKLVLDWKLKTQTKADVERTIRDFYIRLPGAYTPELKKEKRAKTYAHIYENYFGAGLSVYQGVGGAAY